MNGLHNITAKYFFNSGLASEPSFNKLVQDFQIMIHY